MSELKPPDYLLDALKSRQHGTKSFTGFWLHLLTVIEQFSSAINKELLVGQIEFQASPQSATLSYEGRRITILCDAPLGVISYKLVSALHHPEVQQAAFEIDESGSWGVAAEGESIKFISGDLRIHTSSETLYKWSAAQQIAERLLSKLVAPGWKDGRFDGAP